MGYPTIVEIKDYLGITGTEDDAWIQATLDTVIDAVEQYCQRVFPLEADIVQTDFNANGASTIYLQQWPLVAIASIEVTPIGGTVGTVLDAARYRMDSKKGAVYLQSPQSGDIKATYEGGFDPIPPGVTYTINESMKSLYINKDTDPSALPVKSERVDGAVTIAYDTSLVTSEGGSSGGDVPVVIAPFTTLLDTYRSERVWGAW